MNPSVVQDIVQLAPIVEPLLVEAAKGLISLFERLFPPKSGPAKQAAVIQATQTVAQQTGKAVPTDQEIAGIIAAELPGILEKMANPPAVIPVEEHQAVVAGLQAQLDKATTPPVQNTTHGVTFNGSTPVLNVR